MGCRRPSWPGWGCKLNVFWENTVRLHASMMPSALCPHARDVQSTNGSSKQMVKEVLQHPQVIVIQVLPEHPPLPTTSRCLAEDKSRVRTYRREMRAGSLLCTMYGIVGSQSQQDAQCMLSDCTQLPNEASS